MRIYSTKQLCNHAGTTYRRVDYWARHGVLNAYGSNIPGSGVHRRWSRREVQLARVVARLADLGAQTPVLRQVAMNLRLMTPAFDLAGVWFVNTEGEMSPEPLWPAAWAIDLTKLISEPLFPDPDLVEVT